MKLHLTAVAAHASSIIRVGGLLGTVARSGDNITVGLKAGENKVLFTVTSPGELTTRSYVVTVYVLLEDIPGASIASVELFPGDLEPPFAPDVFKYSLIVGHTTEALSVSAVSYAKTPITVCSVQAPSRQLRSLWIRPAANALSPEGSCHTMASGDDGRDIPLRDGFNLVEIKAVPQSRADRTLVYQLLVFRRLSNAAPAPPPAPTQASLWVHPFVSLASGSPGLPAGPEAVRSGAGYARAFSAFNNLPPGRPGRFDVRVGGSRCGGGRAVGGPSAPFAVERQEAHNVSLVLRTPIVYADGPGISLAYWLTDEDGHPQARPHARSTLLCSTRAAAEPFSLRFQVSTTPRLI